MKNKLCVLGLIFSIGMCVPSYGNYNHDALNTYEWELIDGNWYYKDTYGNAKTGKFYDEFGNIYDTDNTEDGRIIVSGKNRWGEQFDDNGRLINPSMENSQYYKTLSEQYENGEQLVFNSAADFLAFIKYYTVQYRLSTYTEPYPLETSNGLFVSTLPEHFRYNRNDVEEAIREKFGDIEGDDDYQKIVDACKKISQIDYNSSYQNRDILSCIENDEGVCWHYAKITSMLLKNAGIDNEIIVGYSYNEYHMWLRCQIEGRWVYIDPVGYDRRGISYADIAYQTYIDNYQVEFENLTELR